MWISGDNHVYLLISQGHLDFDNCPDFSCFHCASMQIAHHQQVNVAAMFGVKSIRHEKRVDLVITLKAWEQVNDIDRVGMDQEFVKILGADVPHIVIPVRPGRDLARLIEVAAFQTKLKMSGYNPAQEFNDRLIAQMSPGGK